MVPDPEPEAAMAFRVTRGTGIGGGREGLLYKNVLATYTHLHALGAPHWARALVLRSREYRRDLEALGEPASGEGFASPKAVGYLNGRFSPS
jgi:cobyrinic acid a,c-diamide synthase